LLSHPSRHNHPFPFFHVTPAFSAKQCAELERAFLHAGEWQHRDGAFYRCSLRDVTENISAAFRAEVIARMREITGLPLVNRILITAQRMLPGQIIGVHSDRPLLGYECGWWCNSTGNGNPSTEVSLNCSHRRVAKRFSV
jgi:hypothetical protein